MTLKINNMDELSELQSTILSLVVAFVDRQSIVLEALRDLRPDLVMRYYDKEGTLSQLAVLRDKYVRSASTGYWGENSEWAYFLHGPGCRLTHVHTKEVIEWDIGSLDKFNVDWFIRHLQSLFRQEVNDDLVLVGQLLPDAYRIKELTDHELSDQWWAWKKLIEPILLELCELGYLSKGSSFTYKIVR